MLNRYFIINMNDAKIADIYTECVSDANSIRKSLDGTLGVVKLPLDEDATPGCLSAYEEYNHSEIKTELDNTTWVDDE